MDADDAALIDDVAVIDDVELTDDVDVDDGVELVDAVELVDGVELNDDVDVEVVVLDGLKEDASDVAGVDVAVTEIVVLPLALEPPSTLIAVYMALKLEPSELYGSTSAPRKAYDCWLASACKPELSYVATRTATLTKLSTASSGEMVAVNTPAEHAPDSNTPTAVFPTLTPTVTPAPWLALVLTTDVLLLLSPTSNLTCVLTPQVTGALASSYTVAVAVIAPPTNESTDSSVATLLTLRKRYIFATPFSRYCASALVGHGGPYVVPYAHVDRSNAVSR